MLRNVDAGPSIFGAGCLSTKSCGVLWERACASFELAGAQELGIRSRSFLVAFGLRTLEIARCAQTHVWRALQDVAGIRLLEVALGSRLISLT
jgi:hypothetical protein